MAGQWYDWMWHINYATDNTGFVELWRKGPGDSNYVKIVSKYNYVTQFIQPGFTPTTQSYHIRVGQYGDLSATNPQTIYILNPKLARLVLMLNIKVEIFWNHK